MRGLSQYHLRKRMGACSLKGRQIVAGPEDHRIKIAIIRTPKEWQKERPTPFAHPFGVQCHSRSDPVVFDHRLLSLNPPGWL